MTEDETRQYAAHLIARSQFSWDEIAERHPSGEILEQEDCDKVMDALVSATVVLLWDEDDILETTAITYLPEER